MKIKGILCFLVAGMVVGIRGDGQASISRESEIPDYGHGESFEVYLPNLQPGWQALIMVRVPAGFFQMGSPPGEEFREENEGPAHPVTLSTEFYLGRCEITQGQWLALMDENPSTQEGADLPVNKVSWEDCQEFINRLNRYANETRFRLPTEAEFEYACRAGTATTTFLGESPSEEEMEAHAWFRNNSEGEIHPVGQLAPNPWGLFDIYGNVWEWCLDWYAPYAGDKQTDPVGPQQGEERVMRGASWMAKWDYLRSADRGKFTPEQRRNTGGFRLVWSTTRF